MKEITIKLSDENARRWAHFLRQKFNRDKRTGLSKLVELAALHAVREQAKKYFEEVENADNI